LTVLALLSVSFGSAQAAGSFNIVKANSLWLDSTTHRSYIFAAGWSPDSKRVGTAGFDNVAVIWDAASGKKLMTLKGHSAGLRFISWSPDGKKIATAADDRTVRIWDARSGAQIKVLTGHSSAVFCVVWSPDGRKLASSGCNDLHSTEKSDDTIRIWDYATGSCERVLTGQTNGIYSVAWSPDGRNIASGANDRTICIWDAATGILVQTLLGHTSEIRSVAWSPNGTRLASGGADSSLLVWDAATGKNVISVSEGDHVRSVSWSPDGTMIGVSGRNITLRIHDSRTGASLKNFTESSGSVFSLAWSPDGSKVAVGSAGSICAGGYNSIRVYGEVEKNPSLKLSATSGLAVVVVIGSVVSAVLFYTARREARRIRREGT
jgi:WD40 repeat protein